MKDDHSQNVNDGLLVGNPKLKMIIHYHMHVKDFDIKHYNENYFTFLPDSFIIHYIEVNDGMLRI